MSDPTSPTPPQPGEPERTDATAPVSPDAQPTEAYDPPAAQPTAAYPPADFQPTEAYAPAAQGAYGQPGSAPYGQPGAPATAYADPAFAQAPAGATPPGSPDQRPRTLGWISLALAVGGLLLVAAAFIPISGVLSVILTVLGGLAMTVGLILGVVTLASKKQGGKGLGIGAVVVSVIGGIVWIVALIFSLSLMAVDAGMTSAPADPTPSASVEATPDAEDDTEEEAEEPSGTYDEAAYLAEVRPGITALMQQVDPNVTEEIVSTIYTDEVLIGLGKSMLGADQATLDLFVTQLTEASGGAFTEEQAAQYINVLFTAAEAHLQ